MKQKIILLCLCLVCTGLSTYAQWVVSDPTNLAQGIVNSTKQVVEAAKNGSTMLQSFQETVKIYEQGKRYYDALKSVSNCTAPQKLDTFGVFFMKYNPLAELK